MRPQGLLLYSEYSGPVGRELGIYSVHQHYGQYAAWPPQSTLSLPLKLPTKQIRTTE